MKLNLAARLFRGVVLAILIVGCATTRVDWNARIGNFTFDQAVAELGPPDKSAKLSDGKAVVEWVTRHYNGSTVAVGTGLGYGFGGVGYVQNVGPNTYETSLRLTFTTNNVLADWKKNW